MAQELVAPDDADGDAGEVLLPTVGLTSKEALFVRAFSDVESESFGKATKSAEVAGFSEPHNAAWKLRRRPRIVAAIAEYEKLVRVQIGKVLSDLEFTRLAALTKGDLATAARCSELQGKHLAMFTDAVFVDNSATVERYDARRADQAARITAILLRNPENRPLLPKTASQDAPGAAPTPALDQSIEGPAAPGPVRATAEQIKALAGKRYITQTAANAAESE